MRNVPVVLVPLCIGLTSGFIVPSGIHEKLFNENESHIFNYKKIKSREVNAQNVTHADINSNTDAELNTTKKLAITDKAKNNKFDEDLYKDINIKDVNISERSFIYIKQITRRPLQTHLLLNILPKERIDISKTNASYLLNRNNVFEEFHRRFLLGRTYIDKNKGDNNLVLVTTEHYCNTNIKNSGNCKKTVNSNYNYHDGSNVFKEKEKKIFSDIEPFSKLYVSNVKNKETVTFKPDVKYSGKMFSLQPVIKLSDKVIDPLVKPNLKSGNRNDAIEAERLDIKTFLDQELKRQNSNQIDRLGFYFCLDCIKKFKKQNLKNPVLIKKNCICRHESVKK